MEIKNIGIYGIGALGSNLLVQLAKTFPNIEYSGVDMDIVEGRNVGPQTYFLEHSGMRKVDAMRVVLARYLRQPKYKPFYIKIDRPEKVGKHDLTIDCFDNAASRDVFKSVTGAVLHIGFSPEYSAECLWNGHYTTPNDIAPGKMDVCSMEAAIPFINLTVSMAALVVGDFIRNGKQKEFLITNRTRIKWL